MRNFDCLNILGEKWEVEYHNDLIDNGKGGKTVAQVNYDEKLIRVYKKQNSIDLLECFIHEFFHIIVEREELNKFKTIAKEISFNLDEYYEYRKYKKNHPFRSLISEFLYKMLRKLWDFSIGNQSFSYILVERRVDLTAKSLSKILYDNRFINPEYK